jgi:hypothetical protein
MYLVVQVETEKHSDLKKFSTFEEAKTDILRQTDGLGDDAQSLIAVYDSEPKPQATPMGCAANINKECW